MRNRVDPRIFKDAHGKGSFKSPTPKQKRKEEDDSKSCHQYLLRTEIINIGDDGMSYFAINWISK